MVRWCTSRVGFVSPWILSNVQRVHFFTVPSPYGLVVYLKGTFCLSYRWGKASSEGTAGGQTDQSSHRPEWETATHAQVSICFPRYFCSSRATYSCSRKTYSCSCTIHSAAVRPTRGRWRQTLISSVERRLCLSSTTRISKSVWYTRLNRRVTHNSSLDKRVNQYVNH